MKAIKTLLTTSLLLSFMVFFVSATTSRDDGRKTDRKEMSKKERQLQKKQYKIDKLKYKLQLMIDRSKDGKRKDRMQKKLDRIKKTNADGLSTATFVIGLAGLVFVLCLFIPYVGGILFGTGMALSLTGLIMGIISRNQEKNTFNNLGFIFGIVGLCLGVLLIILYIAIFAALLGALL